MAQARDAAANAKELCRKAIQKSLKLDHEVDFQVDHQGKLVVFRPKERQARAGKLPDLTASA